MNGNSRDLNQSGVPRALATEHLYGAVLPLLDTPLGGRILDMPAGQGAFAQALLERGAEEIHCLDINAEAFVLSDRRVAFLKHDAMQSLPFPDA